MEAITGDYDDIENELIGLIDLLSEYGQDSEGGITRLLYTKEWIDAQNALMEILKEKNFTPYFDDIGNQFGRIEGSIYKNETILTGSHIDTVVNGGKYDGQFGIIGGIIAIEYLNKKYGQPLRNIEVVAIAEEEGSRFPFTFWGSKNIVSKIGEEQVRGLKDNKDIGFVEAMEEAGFNFKNGHSPERKDIRAFIELHIEQGGVLEKEKKTIGIVNHIVGQRRFTVEVMGEANHSGTTPMGYRKDALYITSKLIQEIIDAAKEYGDPLVTTVGSLEVTPNTVNVVPGECVFSLDVRHVKKKVLEEFTDDIYRMIKRTKNKMDININTNMYMDSEPAIMDPNLVSIIHEQCKNKNRSYKMMHSGAGHDAQIFAEHIPTALIFVPSHKGVSHNPAEFTETKDLVEGIKVLIEILHDLAYV